MQYLIVRNSKIGIHLNTQIGTAGREFKMIGTAKNLEMPEKWNSQKKSECWYWIYTFKYLDDSEIFELEFDYNNNFVRKLSPTFI